MAYVPKVLTPEQQAAKADKKRKEREDQELSYRQARLHFIGIEPPVSGWENIAAILGLHDLRKYEKELQKSGAIFWVQKAGEEPEVRAFASNIKKWVQQKSKRGEVIYS